MAPVIQHNIVQKGNSSSFSGAHGWTCSDIVSHCSATTDLKKNIKANQCVSTDQLLAVCIDLLLTTGFVLGTTAD